MEIDWASLSAFAAVFAAVVAGIFLLIRGYLDRKSTELQARISSENAILQARLTSGVKLAEFRQQWINALRDDLAACQAMVARMHSDKTNIFDYLEIENRIRLRMNPKDENYKPLIECLNSLRSGKTPEAAVSAIDPFIQISQAILKSEWDRLRGELQSLSATGPIN